MPSRVVKEALKRGNRYAVEFPYDDLQHVPTSRENEDLASGRLHVIWGMSSLELEEKFQAVYIPIYRGLLGMRVAIVKKENRNMFSNVKTLDDFKQFSAGQGTTWPDTKILEANGIPVIKELKYFNLFPMLEGGRFDYFPRGAHEPWGEIVREAKYNLTVDPYLLVRYRAPTYLFVPKDRQDIARHLTQQLELMVSDGTLESLFFADPNVQQALNNANLQDRIVFDINNPQLTDKTPLDRSELWFDPLTYKH
ncbi:hypothetical protein [Algibacillus agarilyticus]|uniref:hypothetical protein n=1 Tax=Algibacillus agarilyticus TaxID=2234133 RepID=UPI0018E59163|nr:hypothetical protein [Algibacillus agarilyticus]